ncbi:MAG TPA: serine acetyltransferase [Terriglobia bacterium]|nr:serine acetyltransferase [Terriglobia bacterium]
MFDNLREDLRQARKINVGPSWGSQYLKILIQPMTLAVVVYRFGRSIRRFPIPILRHALYVVSAIVRFMVEIATGIIISPGADIGPGFVVHTPYGVFVGPTKIGKNCVVQHGVVIGYGARGIGDNVFFGPGAKVIGNAKIGSNVVVMANSVVITDVPDNLTVAGVPVRIRLPRGSTLKFRERAERGNGFEARAARKLTSKV